jgi:hypothetical protein
VVLEVKIGEFTAQGVDGLEITSTKDAEPRVNPLTM